MNEQTTPPPKPLPVVQPWARPYWEAARAGRLALQHCRRCDLHIHYPRIACPHCGADDLGWKDASGRGTIYSFTIVQANAPSAFVAGMPYVVAVVRLAEGVQMLTNIVECDPAALVCDQPVEVVFERLNDEFTLPQFRPLR